MKTCRTFEHTADVGLEAQGGTLNELMEAMAEGLADIIRQPEGVRAQDMREIRVQAEDVEALAVDFLTEVMNLIQSDRYMVAAVRVRQAAPNALVADLVGEPFDPARHDYKTEVKAVTYHLLKVAQRDDVWHGRVVLDL